MRFYLVFFGGIALILAVLVGGYWFSEKAPEVSDKINDGLSAKFVEDGKPVSSNTNRNQPSLSPQEAAQQRATMVQQAALRAGVTLLNYQDQGNSVLAKIKWGGSNAAKGGDFLDQFLNVGRLRDFESLDATSGFNDRGQQEYTATYRLFLR